MAVSWGWGQLVIRVHKDFGPPAPQAVVRHIALHDLHGPPEIHRNHGVFYVFFGRFDHQQMAMDQYLWIPFLVGWTSIYQLFWCSPGVQGFDTLPNDRKTGVSQALVGHTVPHSQSDGLIATLHATRPARSEWGPRCHGHHCDGDYPLVRTNITIEHGPVEIVDLPMVHMVIFHRFLYVYQTLPGQNKLGEHRQRKLHWVGGLGDFSPWMTWLYLKKIGGNPP